MDEERSKSVINETSSLLSKEEEKADTAVVVEVVKGEDDDDDDVLRRTPDTLPLSSFTTTRLLLRAVIAAIVLVVSASSAVYVILRATAKVQVYSSSEESSSPLLPTKSLAALPLLSKSHQQHGSSSSSARPIKELGNKKKTKKQNDCVAMCTGVYDSTCMLEEGSSSANATSNCGGGNDIQFRFDGDDGWSDLHLEMEWNTADNGKHFLLSTDTGFGCHYSKLRGFNCYNAYKDILKHFGEVGMKPDNVPSAHHLCDWS